MIRNGSYLSKEKFDMIDNWSALDRLEHAERETPFCSCGQPTSPVARSGGIWLECVSLQEPADSRIGRLLSAINVVGHTRQMVVGLVEDAA
jgi:hypothetical protein